MPRKLHRAPRLNCVWNSAIAAGVCSWLIWGGEAWGQQLTFLNSFGGSGSSNALSSPNAVAVGPTGLVFVTNPGLNLVDVYNTTGAYQNDIGPTILGNLNQTPYGVAVTSSNVVYVSNAAGQTVRPWTPTGNPGPAFGSSGTGNGQFTFPSGIAINNTLGYIYVADFTQSRIQAFSTAGVYQFQFGQGTLNTPVGMSLDPSGNLYVADGNNNRIDIFSSTGTLQKTFGSLGNSPGQFHAPTGVAVGATGITYVADADNSRVEVFDASQTFQESTTTAGARSLNTPYGIAVAPTGMVYVAEQVGNIADRYFDPASWVSGTNVFTDPTVGPTSLDVGTGEILALH